MAKPWDVTSDEIAQWAQRYDAPGVLPDLVRRLCSRRRRFLSLSMSAHAGTRLPGWDGMVVSSKATAFCPDGVSVWELTVEDAARKLNEDFEKRSIDTLGVAPRASTYVAVGASHAEQSSVGGGLTCAEGLSRRALARRRRPRGMAGDGPIGEPMVCFDCGSPGGGRRGRRGVSGRMVEADAASFAD